MPEPVPPNGDLTRRADDHFLRHLGIGFEALAAPVDPANPTGLPARATSVYRAIIEARQGDEDIQPRGVWQRQPKRSDWPHVSNLAAGALRTQGKDLQLAAWLCESQVHEHGLGALAPCLLLAHTLCERYPTALHPQLETDDTEARANILRWLDQKLAPTLRQSPLFTTEDGCATTWADCEQTAHELDGDATARGTLAAIPPAILTERITALEDAHATIALLHGTFNTPQTTTAPCLRALADQVHAILSALHNERAVRVPAPAPADVPTEAPSEQTETPATAPTTNTTEPHQFRDRADAYACLAAAATYLAHLEPHSPTPYLIKRAVEWGNMNTGALYQELFIRLGGQLSIFDMVGTDMLPTPQKPIPPQ
ncbi:MAG: type VI secretion system protein TssA [Massilia sp.]|uniref:type VI secretion system protein TssA n=1 Tax=Massilia sp. TaxID=1882437 RepID=UPI002FC8CEE1